MKQRYLPIQDRKNLRALKNTDDKKEILEILESIFFRDHYMLQGLWEYRKWFYELSEEELRNSPILTYERIQIAIYEGKLDFARSLLEYFPLDSPLKILGEMTIPGCSSEAFFRCLDEIKKTPLNLLNFAYTLGTPTILNGVWDITPITPNFEKHKQELYDDLKVHFPDDAENIFGIMEAEILFYKNKCYEALIKIIGLIPILTEKKKLHLLFIARDLEAWIMIVNGNAVSANLLMDDMKRTFIANGKEEYIPNMEALDAWAAMYVGDIKRIMNWFRNGAPDENSNFCMLDIYRYLIKIRAYIIQGKKTQLISLASRLEPMLIIGERTMDRSLLHLLWGICEYDSKNWAEALKHAEIAVNIAEKYGLERVLANEATKAYRLFVLYSKERGMTPFLKKLIDMSKDTMLHHPDYLKTLVSDKISLTPSELRVLKLIEAYKTNEEIAVELKIAVTTVKKHCQNIMKKLSVKNRRQAVLKAYELNLIEKKNP